MSTYVRMIIGLMMCSFFFVSAQSAPGRGGARGAVPAASLTNVLKGLQNSDKPVEAHSIESKNH